MRYRHLLAAALLAAAVVLPHSVLAGWYGGAFSADIIMTNPKDPGQKAEGKMYAGDQKVRAEGSHNGQTKAVIINAKARQIYTLTLDKQEYYKGLGDAPMPPKPDVDEMPDDPQGPCANTQYFRCKKLGNDTVNGMATEVWDVTQTHQGQSHTIRLWVDTTRKLVIQTMDAKRNGTSRKLLGNEPVNGRDAEKWEVTTTHNNQSNTMTQWVDSTLRVPLKIEGGQFNVELTNVQEGPQDDSLFNVPQGFREVQPPKQQGGQQQQRGGGQYR